MKTISTYRDLLESLQNCTEEQLSQPVQTVNSHPCEDYVYELISVICFSTVDDLGLKYARSSKDNRRNGDELVLFTDGNPHSENGAIAWEMNFAERDEGEDLIGRNDTPIFPKNHDPSCDWTGPAQKIADEAEKTKGSGTLGPILLHRLKSYTDGIE